MHQNPDCPKKSKKAIELKFSQYLKYNFFEYRDQMSPERSQFKTSSLQRVSVVETNDFVHCVGFVYIL